MLLFFLLIAVALIPNFLLVLNATMIGNRCTFNASGTTSYTVFEPLNEETCILPRSCFFCEADVYQPILTKFENEDAQQLYCAQFSRRELADSQRNKFLSPDDIGIDQAYVTLYGNTHFLPLGPGSTPFGVDLLPNSNFSVFVCLDETTLPSLEVLLFSYDDWTHLADAQPLQPGSKLKFNESLCGNTSITNSEAALVVPALSSPSNVKFKVVQGYVNQYYYDRKVQNQLKNATNLINTGKPLQKRGSASMKLLCYIQGGQHNEVFSGLIGIAIAFTWQKWTLYTMIPVAIILWLLAMAITVVTYCVCKKQPRRQRSGYGELVNPT